VFCYIGHAAGAFDKFSRRTKAIFILYIYIFE